MSVITGLLVNVTAVFNAVVDGWIEFCRVGSLWESELVLTLRCSFRTSVIRPASNWDVRLSVVETTDSLNSEKKIKNHGPRNSVGLPDTLRRFINELSSVWDICLFSVSPSAATESCETCAAKAPTAPLAGPLGLFHCVVRLLWST